MSADPLPEPAPDPRPHRYSVVIPVYNSEQVVGRRSTTSSASSRPAGLDLELVLVNDGSRDGSWAVVSDKVRTIPGAVAVNLLKNYGQHHANLAGLRETTGDYVITMDDDGQNPADQVPLLIDAALEGGYDVVFGRFEQKQAPLAPPARQHPDRPGQPADLQPATRPGGLQLPHPAARRRRPHLRVADGPPLRDRSGAALLEPSRQRHRAPRGRAPPAAATTAPGGSSGWC